jgi:hypothetical protein
MASPIRSDLSGGLRTQGIKFLEDTRSLWPLTLAQRLPNDLHGSPLEGIYQPSQPLFFSEVRAETLPAISDTLSTFSHTGMFPNDIFACTSLSGHLLPIGSGLTHTVQYQSWYSMETFVLLWTEQESQHFTIPDVWAQTIQRLRFFSN